MADLRLAKLPDRTPVELTIAVMPELHQRLVDYASLYATTYGAQESVADLVPAMLAAFLASDRAFSRAARRSGSMSEP